MSMTKTDSILKVTDNRLSARKQDEVTDANLPVMVRAAHLVTEALNVADDLVAIKARPLGDKILVLPLPPSEHYSSIIIPEEARAEQTCGIVIAVGSGYIENGLRVPLEVKVGNYVVYTKYSAMQIEIGGHQVAQIREEDIRVVVG